MTFLSFALSVTCSFDVSCSGTFLWSFQKHQHIHLFNRPFRFDLFVVCVVHVSSLSAQADEDVSSAGLVVVDVALQHLLEQRTDSHVHQHFPADVDSTDYRSTQIHAVERFDASFVPLLFSSPLSFPFWILILIVIIGVDALDR